MKSAGKARNNGLYRHIRTSKEIIRNLLNDYENSYVRQYPNLHSGEQQKNICRPVPQRRLKLS